MILLIKTNLETLLYFCVTLGEKILSFHSKDCVWPPVCAEAVVAPQMNAYSILFVDALGFCVQRQTYCPLYFGFTVIGSSAESYNIFGNEESPSSHNTGWQNQ